MFKNFHKSFVCLEYVSLTANGSEFIFHLLFIRFENELGLGTYKIIFYAKRLCKKRDQQPAVEFPWSWHSRILQFETQYPINLLSGSLVWM